MRIPSSPLFVAGAAACLVSTAAVAQQGQAPADAPVASDNEITVTGTRKSLTSMMKSVLSEASETDQLGRFEERVCPGVAGLPENIGSTIVQLIRANAEQAGLKLLPEGCAPNAVAVFVSDPQALVQGLHKKDRSLFGNMTARQMDALLARNHPIVSWRILEMKHRSGSAVGQAQSVNGTTVGRGVSIVRNASASRVAKSVRQDIKMSLAAVRLKAAHGKTVQQLADIATLHLFLDVAPEATEKAHGSSMLSLFTPGKTAAQLPQKLSALDWGMLRGLYRGSDNALSASQQRSRMVTETRRIGQTEE